jgi:hypothetical protein
VTAPIDGSYLVSPAKSAEAGREFTLPVGVANLGNKAWGTQASGTRRAGDTHPATNAVLVARWMALGADAATAAPTPDVLVDLQPALGAGAIARVAIEGTAPATPGEYLLMLDVVAPNIGSLTAKGVAPGMVRVTVTAPPG